MAIEVPDTTAAMQSFIQILHAITDVALLDPNELTLQTVRVLAQSHDSAVAALNESETGYRVIGPRIADSLPADVQDPDISRLLAIVLQQLLNAGGLILCVDRWHHAVTRHAAVAGELPLTLRSGEASYGLDLYIAGVRSIHSLQSRFYANMPAFAQDDVQEVATAVPLIEYRGTVMSFATIVMSSRVAFLG